MKRARAFTDTAEMTRDLLDALDVLRTLSTGTPGTEDAFATVETFSAIALRIIAKTNPSKVRDVARTVEIQYLIQPAFKEAA